jgi:Flp pilus assembly protein TadG
MRSPQLAKTRGVAAVEFAVVLPPLLLLVLGAIEFSRVISVQHALQEASLTGCRLYAISDKSQADATAIIDQSLAAAGISGYTVAYNPPTKAEVDTQLEPVKVTISVPYDAISLGTQWIMPDSIISASSILPADVLMENGAWN